MADRFDLDAIDADDALLDLLAAGGESARTAGERDPAVKLLADLRLAVEVEDELPVETIDDPESFLARCAALNPVTDPFARKMAVRGVALGVAAVAALSVSGVAAAVTGDPLSPYEKVIEKMVDAVRPETSFPKEQLDGMPVVDKTKIVKVAKDYQKKQDERQLAEQDKAEKQQPTPPAAVVQQALPEVLRILPEVEKETVKPLPPPAPTTTAPEQTDNGTTDEQPVDTPTTEPTGEPTAPTTTEPTADPTTPTTTEPTTDPTTPTTTEPTEPSPTPTTPPKNDQTGTETGDTGSDPTTTPTTGPSSETGVDEGSGETGDTEAQQPEATQPPVETTPPADSPLDGLVDLVEKVLSTPDGSAVGAPSVEQFFGSGLTSEAKHSSGKVATGSVKETYAKGKHSTGSYAEGRHAAIARAHGSTDSTSVLTILDVVNKPTN